MGDLLQRDLPSNFTIVLLFTKMLLSVMEESSMPHHPTETHYRFQVFQSDEQQLWKDTRRAGIRRSCIESVISHFRWLIGLYVVLFVVTMTVLYWLFAGRIYYSSTPSLAKCENPEMREGFFCQYFWIILQSLNGPAGCVGSFGPCLMGSGVISEMHAWRFFSTLELKSRQTLIKCWNRSSHLEQYIQHYAICCAVGWVCAVAVQLFVVVHDFDYALGLLGLVTFNFEKISGRELLMAPLLSIGIATASIIVCMRCQSKISALKKMLLFEYHPPETANAVWNNYVQKKRC
ncbi:uncharacterized protein LOC129588424 [Paramacrobiotus metropolitanus]|uniref:uncharacterized protein LOC129588424 n=1 Tax=Paramacrobiotus metropolitanus TaxID=2943436 RepID=UPI0024458DE4|nr:uncharacterized protein LOC129588424 [Paramacrobiotus metropolitanus]